MAPSPAQAAKDTIVIAIPGLPQGVDLDKHIGPQTWTMAAQLHEWGLQWEFGPYPYASGAYFDPNNIPGYEYPVGYSNQHTAPGIMTGCDLSADGKTITYHLRQGVISAAGNEFTADDVIWRFDREHKRPIIYALISRLFNLDKATYEKVDKYTVKLTNPTAAPLACSGLTNFYYPWPNSKEIAKHATADDPFSDKWIATHAGGFGAYSVTEWTPGKRAVMEANPHYWRGAPQIKRIIWLVVPESSGTLGAAREGHGRRRRGPVARRAGGAQELQGGGARRGARQWPDVADPQQQAEAVRRPAGAPGDQLPDSAQRHRQGRLSRHGAALARRDLERDAGLRGSEAL